MVVRPRSAWAARVVVLAPRHPAGFLPLRSPPPKSTATGERLARLRNQGYHRLVMCWRPGSDVDDARLRRFARSLGFAVSVLVDDVVGVLPIEDGTTFTFAVDGPREVHDRARRGRGTYDDLVAAMRTLANAKQRFGLRHTVAPAVGVAELTWLVQLAVTSHAAFIEVAPDPTASWSPRSLDEAGAAVDGLQRAFALPIVSDFTPVGEVLATDGPWMGLARRSRADGPLSVLVPRVAIDPRGAVWPLSTSMHASQCIASGSAAQFEGDLRWYGESGALPLRSLVQDLLPTLATGSRTHLDWAATLATASARPKARIVDLTEGKPSPDEVAGATPDPHAVRRGLIVTVDRPLARQAK